MGVQGWNLPVRIEVGVLHVKHREPESEAAGRDPRQDHPEEGPARNPINGFHHLVRFQAGPQAADQPGPGQKYQPGDDNDHRLAARLTKGFAQPPVTVLPLHRPIPVSLRGQASLP